MKEIAYCFAEHPTLKFMGIGGPQALGISQTFFTAANYAAFS